MHKNIQNFLWNGLDIIFYSSSNPTKHFQIDTTRPKLLKDCIKAVIHSSRKKNFLNKLSLYSRISKNFGILFYILGIRLLVLKQAWAELNQAKSILHNLFFDQWKYETRLGCFGVTAMLSWGQLKLRLIEVVVDWSWGWSKLRLFLVEVDWSWGWLKLRLIKVEVDWSWGWLKLRLIEVKVNLYWNLWNVFEVYSCRLITFILYNFLFSDFLILWYFGEIVSIFLTCGEGLGFM